MSTPDLSLRIDCARWWALSEQPFYGSLLMRLAIVETDTCQTAATDGRSIKINPTWAAGLTDEELRFILLHETLHCAHMHQWRLPATERGNIAGDHEINLTLETLPGVSMPAGGCADPQYRGKSCEEILGSMPDEQPEQDQGQGSGAGDPGAGDDGQGQPGQGKPDPCGSFTAPSPDDGSQTAQEAAQAAQDLRDYWEQAVVQAAQAAQALGKGAMPADLARILERIKSQPIDWRQELAEFLRQAGAGKNDWARAARRHAWQSVIYPRRKPDNLGVIICARDTSGSINGPILAEFSALIDDCVSVTGARVLVIDCDAAIQGEYWIEAGMGCPTTAQGGGGTDFRPVFERAKELADSGEHVAGIVYLTDLEGTEPDETEFPALWLATSSAQARTGRTVRVMT